LAGASLGQDYFVPSDVWSRDGTRILATFDPCEDTERLVSFDLATGAQTELARGGFMRFVFSPDARWVAYTTFGTNAYVVSADGRSVPQLVSEDVAAPFTPTWSPDSRYAAFQANFGGYDRCLI
jgi:Tol biopolymer transport system component